MVYHGPSRGCETCKRRRKKCDETRPSCLRCITSNRTCGGYENSANRIFRHNDVPHAAPQFTSIARKCTLPARVTDANDNTTYDDFCPKEVSDEEVEEFALRAFFYDYCIASLNKSLSRGFLDGLEELLHRSGLHSDLGNACKAVAFASNGIKLRRPGLTRKAEAFYHKLLGTLASAIQDPMFAYSTVSLMIAMLLGLYEIIMTDGTRPGNHNAHARGVIAILRMDSSLLYPIGCMTPSLDMSHPFFRNVRTKREISIGADLGSTKQGLEYILLPLGLVWDRIDTVKTGNLTDYHGLCKLRDDAMKLERELSTWQDAQVPEVRPRTVGQISQENTHQTARVCYWPGNVDKYFDLYVAGIWNIVRMARLVLIDIMLEILELVGDNHDHTHEHRNALRLVDDLVASIPYHLSDDLSYFLRNREDHAAEVEPARPVGGLLLMHPIYVAANLAIVPQHKQRYMKSCLAWIGTYMGVGQASLFAKAQRIDKQCFADGCTILWTGSLI